MNTRVVSETAKLLKEKGFKIDTEKVLFYRDEVNNIEEHQVKNRDILYFSDFNYIVGENEYQTYTIAQVVMWLYEKHGIWMWVEKGVNPDNFYPVIQKYVNFKYSTFHWKDTISEAYEAAIEYCLRNLI